MIGKTLGHYEITDKLGQGGMGSVWLAQDAKLGRHVAIKTLPEEFAKDEERLARFEREAKLLASLNHPNIATIHGLEEDNGTCFLVLELVEGDTLADRLKRGAIPVEEALQLNLQIAEALETAHEKGVIHRDLKPANIKVTPEGKIKVLDFGLAKAFQGDGADVNLSQSPTLSMAATQQGVILGTAAYMSPEQARGQEVDKRADVWAFGCVLYEMLAGRQLWEGPTATDMIAAAIAKDADFSTLAPSVDSKIRELLQRCLQKDPRNRRQSVGDVRVDLQALMERADTPTQLEALSLGGRRRIVSATFVLFLVAVAIAISVMSYVGSREPTRMEVFRLTSSLSHTLDLGSAERPALAISPDGSRLAYVADGQLYERPMNQFVGRAVPGSEGAYSPFFSPDGEWVGFFADNRLKKIALDGGLLQEICTAQFVRGAVWVGDEIIFAPDFGIHGLSRVSSSGGEPSSFTLVKTDVGESRHAWPSRLPGRNGILMTVNVGDEAQQNYNLAAVSLETGERTLIMEEGGPSEYLPTGHLAYVRGGQLMAVPLDPDRLETVGMPSLLVDNVMQHTRSGAAQFSVSASGSMAFIPGGLVHSQYRLVWVTRDGVTEPLNLPPRNYVQPRISPDGTRLATGIQEDRFDVWVYDIRRGIGDRVTVDGDNRSPIWAPDGETIVFCSERDGVWDLYRISSTGGPLEKITPASRDEPWFLHPESWSTDGKVLFCTGLTETIVDSIWTLALDSGLEPLVGDTSLERGAPALSPDGNWIAYAAEGIDQQQVFLRKYPESGERHLVSADGAREPLWSPDGEQLFYRSGDKMMSVEIKTTPELDIGIPTVLFSGSYGSRPAFRPNYDITPDGDRFLMTLSDDPGVTEINIILNWFEELKERVPVP